MLSEACGSVEAFKQCCNSRPTENVYCKPSRDAGYTDHCIPGRSHGKQDRVTHAEIAANANSRQKGVSRFVRLESWCARG